MAVTSIVRPRGWRRLFTAHFVIDETTAPPQPLTCCRGAYQRDTSGVWRYAWGDPVPGASDLTVAEWRYTEGRLEFTVEGDALDPAQLVKAVQGIPGLAEVRVRPGQTGRGLILSATLTQGQEKA